MQIKKETPNEKALKLIMKRFEKYKKENESLLKKYKLQSRVVIAFPKKKKTPLLGKLALWLLNKSGAIVDTEFKVI